MALKSANQPIRWLQRIGARVAKTCVGRAGAYLARLIVEIAKAFLNIKEEDEVLMAGAKTADFVARRTAYLSLDYYLWGISIGIAATAKSLGLGLLGMFCAVWAFEVVAAGVLVFIFETTGKDLSLGSDLRRAADVVHNAIRSTSRVAGHIAVILVFVAQAFLVLVWTGPEKTITFFRKEIGTIPRVIVVTLVLTAIQAFLWAILYNTGYDVVVERWFN